jgi:oligosaccharide repeat unit polymerase
VTFKNIFHPIFLTLAPISLQVALWIYFFDYSGEITLPKNGTLWSHGWFILACLTAMFGVRASVAVSKAPSSDDISMAVQKNVINISGILSVIAFSMYARTNLSDITSFSSEARFGAYDITEDALKASENRIVGLTSLSWLSITCLSAFGYQAGRKITNSPATIFLVLLVLFQALIQSYFLAGRIAIIFPIASLVFSYIAGAGKMHKKFPLVYFIVLVIGVLGGLFMFFLTAERLRSFSSKESLDIESSLTYFLFPYFAKNHWNALQFIESPTYGNLGYAAPVFDRILAYFGYVSRVETPWLDQHGTVVIFGLLYHNFGPLLGLIVVFVLFYTSGNAYFRFVRNPSFRSTLLYAIHVPCLLSCCRANLFGNSHFAVNLLFYLFMVVLTRVGAR